MAQGHFGEPFFMDDPAELDEPFDALARYRTDCPLYFHAPLNQWFVFRYDDVAALLRDPRLTADRMKGYVDQAPESVRAELRKVAPLFSTWVMMLEGPAHQRIRHFVNLGFNASAIQAMRPSIETVTRELLDTVGSKPRFDVAADFAFLLPAYVLADFFGVRVEDRSRVLQWLVDFVDFFNIMPITVDTSRRMIESSWQLTDYMRVTLDDRRANPRDDFLTQLVQAEAQPDGPTPEEIVGNAMLLLLAGHIPVRNLIGNFVHLLDRYPDQHARLRADPSLMESAIEETLRVEPPVTLIPRIALEPIELHGQTIPPGAVVQFSLAAANRDPNHFPEPDRFDVTRASKRILSFGFGPHGCAGVHLARLETEIALRVLFERFPDLVADETQPIQWYRTAANRGPINLLVRTAG